MKKDAFRYAQSHQNDPLGCAIGLEVIKSIKGLGLIEASLEKGGYFKTRLENLLSKYPREVKEVRARGLMLAIEIQSHVNLEEVHKQLLSRGFITGAKEKTLRFMPPLVITQKDIDALINAIDDILESASDYLSVE